MTETASARQGIALGLLAALSWGVYNVGAEIGQASGFRPVDLTLLRYGGAAVLMLPLLILARHRLPPFRQVAVLALLVGPVFALCFNQGFQYAPLSHAVVIGPGMSMLVANLLVRWRDGVRLSWNRRIGMGILICGLLNIAADAPPPRDAGGSVLLGDLFFVTSGSLWGCYVYVMGRWRLPPIETTAAIAALATVVFFPLYLLIWGFPRMAPGLWAEQVFYQGAVGGCLAFVIFAATVQRLGAGRAALFSALVPSTAVLLAIPLTGTWPNALQWTGVGVTTLGLIVSLDLRRSAAARLPEPGQGASRG
ncbi:DMT family transporter [Pararhodobacter zhoushanensis]|uniref:DMT family transporter n=1 Tax=Pararhodobacter zhoushanensis TaxID=2479545 RepID=A0ABT3GXU2_9RHOB|nr:DMT family transporter [Pararhodobacter zhoushanensis]MCW1932358.1 DMT family transporter [Pararhodobacter zhoushanensis]